VWELSELAVELGFEAAINLDGGAASSLARGDSLLDSSWGCGGQGAAEALFRCEKSVASATCMHSAPPPFVSDYWMQDLPQPHHPSPKPSQEPQSPSSRPHLFHSSEPSPAPYSSPESPSEPPYPDPFFSEPLNSTAPWQELQDLRAQLSVYRPLSGALILLLALSLLAHGLGCMRRKTPPKALGSVEYCKLDDGPLPQPGDPAGLEMKPPASTPQGGLFNLLGPRDPPEPQGWGLEEGDFYDDDEEEGEGAGGRTLLRKAPLRAPSPSRARAQGRTRPLQEDPSEPQNPSRAPSRRPLLGRIRDDSEEDSVPNLNSGPRIKTRTDRGREKKSKKGRRDLGSEGEP
jgi:hypothetical protein